MQMHATQQQRGAMLRARLTAPPPGVRRPTCLRVRAAAADLAAPTHTTTNGNGSGNGAAAAAAVTAAAPPAAAAAPAPALPMLGPVDIYNALGVGGQKSGSLSWSKTLVMAMYSGFYISMGGLLGSALLSACPALAAANPGMAKLLFGLVFPVGLYMNILTGMELFTGNTMKLPIAVVEGKASAGMLVKNWFWSFTGNFIASLLFVALVAQTGVLAGAVPPVKLALAKTSLTWGQAFARAVVANWFVCVAVWCATATNSLPGKIMAIWPPIAAFVTIGLEHSVANMFLIPLGIALGADITFGHFLTSNLIPVTLGNIVGGAIAMGLGSAGIYGSLLKKAEPKAA